MGDDRLQQLSLMKRSGIQDHGRQQSRGESEGRTNQDWEGSLLALLRPSWIPGQRLVGQNGFTMRAPDWNAPLTRRGSWDGGQICRSSLDSLQALAEGLTHPAGEARNGEGVRPEGPNGSLRHGVRVGQGVGGAPQVG